MSRVLAVLPSLLVGLLGTGCLIVPAKKVSSKPAPNEMGAKTFATLRSVDLSARADTDKVHVHAVRHGECSRPVYGITEVTTERKAKLGGSDDPRAAVFGLVLAPVLIPVSALVTGFILAGDEPKTERKTKLLGTERFACAEPAADYKLQMTLPSGKVEEATTDERGDATFVVPATESYNGEVAITADGAETKRLAYALPRPAITVAQEATLHCAGVHGVSGPVELKLSINETGRATRLWVSAGGIEFNRCIGQRLSGLRFPEKMRDATVKLPLEIPAATASR